MVHSPKCQLSSIPRQLHFSAAAAAKNEVTNFGTKSLSKSGVIAELSLASQCSVQLLKPILREKKNLCEAAGDALSSEAI